uniref:Uncharacterized protein n=1 Tax=Meloidogyne incognita TaxID=6306 RepID=A0A914MEW1_MELIC
MMDRSNSAWSSSNNVLLLDLMMDRSNSAWSSSNNVVFIGQVFLVHNHHIY